jgi:hypothetical protein
MLTTLRTTRWPASPSVLENARITGCAARRMRNGAVRCTSIIAYHCSSVIFCTTLSQV